MEIDNKAKSTLSLLEYIGKLGNDGKFLIPDYQRGYIWGQHSKSAEGNNQKDSVSYLIETLLHGFLSEPRQENIFLQGITVWENKEKNEIAIIDVQQRTTFFFLLLKYLGFDGHMMIEYAVRKESDDFLRTLNPSDCEKDENEPFQDIYFFKKSLRIFHEHISECDKNDFLSYILRAVRFLYIPITEDKAKIVFTLMNGNKAIMKQEELIKSELLRRSSINTNLIGEAENNAIRSRLAREWDKWLYWWRQEDVESFFHTDRQLGWLLPLTMGTNADVSFEEFMQQFQVGDGSGVKEAKTLFRKMRLLQQSIEDAYDNPKSYNYIGAILNIRNKEQRFAFLKWYFIENEGKNKCELRRYFDWAFIEIAHDNIVKKNIEKYNEKRDDFLTRLEDNLLYQTNYETGARWLLRSNIIEDCTQNGNEGRKFDFKIWSNRSLEHIFPKSQVGHRVKGQALSHDDKQLDDNEIAKIRLWRENIQIQSNDDSEPYRASEHSIGNLVLLYKNDNSKFNASDFEEKKSLYFNIKDDSGFQSRHLLHTVSVFANSTWGAEEIARHKKEEIERFINSYPEIWQD